MDRKTSMSPPKTTAGNNTELDLTEYDQMDEFRHLITDNQNQVHHDNSRILVTMSSSSGQTSPDEANCENDFVFLPAAFNSQQRQREYVPRVRDPIPVSEVVDVQIERAESNLCKLVSQQTQTLPLVSLNNNGNNPFGKYRDASSNLDTYVQRPSEPTPVKRDSIENCLSKPCGLLEVCQSIGNANKLADLMQQIVTRSDLINIAIPCAYCHEPVACPPSDISSWVNHMSRQHNCKVCPICNKMVGLGPDRDINVMRKHVIEHLDNDWLERRANKINFTFGLQQQWFSGSRCNVKDLNQR